MSGNPLLYPGKADEETLRKMPPTIVWDSEFDIYLTEATRYKCFNKTGYNQWFYYRFANRLRAAGRLLELVVIPGSKHGSGMMPIHACFQVEREAWRLAVQEYLVKPWRTKISALLPLTTTFSNLRIFTILLILNLHNFNKQYKQVSWAELGKAQPTLNFLPPFSC